MSAALIDGKMAGAALRGRIADAARVLHAEHALVPGLAVVLVGDDPASDVYVRSKTRATHEAGFHAVEHRLPATVSQLELAGLVDRLNRDPEIHGILVQLPLPAGLDSAAIIRAIDPAKDVDGLTLGSVGALWSDERALTPCTPLGCLILLRSVLPSMSGLRAVILGRSGLVGKPMAALLLAENCTVTIVHSKTQNVPTLCREADILVAAIGRPELVRGDWVKPGATVIDVGINRVPGEHGKSRLVGDVAFHEAVEVAGAITPVPGGVGPMTIACLMRNTLFAACWSVGLNPPEV